MALAIPSGVWAGVGAIGGIAGGWGAAFINSLFQNRRQKHSDRLAHDAQLAVAERDAQSKAAIAQAVGEADLRREFLEQTTTGYRDLVDKIQQLTQTNITLLTEQQRLTGRETQMTEDLGRLKYENEQLRTQAARAEVLAQQVQELQNDLKHERADNAALRAEVVELRRQVDELRVQTEGGSPLTDKLPDATSKVASTA
jgi:DNA repair exonuclease SbcCD ATPase subunit